MGIVRTLYADRSGVLLTITRIGPDEAFVVQRLPPTFMDPEGKQIVMYTLYRL